jgi:hypothetical protein
MLLLPDTPNSLAERNRPDQARRVLERVRGTGRVDEEMRSIQRAVEKGSKVDASLFVSHMLDPPTEEVSIHVCWSKIYIARHGHASVVLHHHICGHGVPLCLPAKTGTRAAAIPGVPSHTAICVVSQEHALPETQLLLLQAGNAWRLLFSAKLRPELVASACVAFFSQINVRSPAHAVACT